METVLSGFYSHPIMSGSFKGIPTHKAVRSCWLGITVTVYSLLLLLALPLRNKAHEMYSSMKEHVWPSLFVKFTIDRQSKNAKPVALSPDLSPAYSM